MATQRPASIDFSFTSLKSNQEDILDLGLTYAPLQVMLLGLICDMGLLVELHLKIYISFYYFGNLLSRFFHSSWDQKQLLFACSIGLELVRTLVLLFKGYCTLLSRSARSDTM